MLQTAVPGYFTLVKKVKFSHTRYRALALELIPCTSSQPASDVK